MEVENRFQQLKYFMKLPFNFSFNGQFSYFLSIILNSFSKNNK